MKENEEGDLHFICPSCKTELSCERKYAGGKVQCPVCRQEMVIPEFVPVAAVADTKEKKEDDEPEEFFMEGKPSLESYKDKMYFWGCFGLLFAWTIFIPVILLFLVSLYIFIDRDVRRFTITNKKIIIHNGFVETNTTRILMKDIRRIDLLRRASDWMEYTVVVTTSTSINAPVYFPPQDAET